MRVGVKAGVIAAGAAVVLGGAGLALWASPWLKLDSVHVVGNQHQSTTEVVTAAGLVRGTRLTSISNAQVAARVAALPWVATAKVSHVLPSQIRIEIHERVPIAIVQGQGRSYLVDAQGAVLQEGSTGYPPVANLPVGVLIPGQKINLPAFSAAVAVLTSAPQPLRSRLATVNAPSANQVSIGLSDGTLIMYGDADNLFDKNYTINALLATGSSYISIDVRAPSHPAVVLR